MKQTTLENQKTFINLFLICLGVLVSLFITNFFFFGGGLGGRGVGGGRLLHFHLPLKWSQCMQQYAPYYAMTVDGLESFETSLILHSILKGYY